MLKFSRIERLLYCCTEQQLQKHRNAYLIYPLNIWEIQCPVNTNSAYTAQFEIDNFAYWHYTEFSLFCLCLWKQTCSIFAFQEMRLKLFQECFCHFNCDPFNLFQNAVHLLYISNNLMLNIWLRIDPFGQCSN